MRNTNPALAQAHELEKRGRLSEAIEAYRRLLAYEPDNSDALHLLGVVLGRTDQPEEACAVLAAAARLQGDNPYIHANLGNALSALRRDAEALRAYERAVSLKPDFAAALHAQGRTQLRLGEPAAAERSLTGAARLLPASSGVQSDLGVALESLNRPTEALSHFERATVLNPNSAEAHHNRGVLQAAQGQLQEALASLERALQLQPRRAAVHANRGNVLADLGRSQDALKGFGHALELEPHNVAVLLSRGRLLLQLQQPAPALNDFEIALAIAPQNYVANFQRALALMLLERPADAVESFDRAIAVRPDAADALNDRGVALSNLGRQDEALESFRRSLIHDPSNVQALINGANTLTVLRQHREALTWFERAHSLKPDDPELNWGLGRLLLTLGDFGQGWDFYDARLLLPHLRPLQRHSELPRWTPGQAIAGKTLLVHAEQGLGDTLQFCRFVPLAETRGARVIFEVQTQLFGLMQTLNLKGELRAVGEELPSFELRTPLLSLPRLLGTELSTIPDAVPYLHAEAERAAAWRQRLAQLPGLKVGLTWQGKVETEKQGGLAGRSYRLSAAAPLAELRGVTLISLQKGAGSEQLAQVDFAARVLELTDPWDLSAAQMLEMAALMSGLDLIVTSDTVTAHLAGALGLPVWVMLSSNADWRWLLDREDSPWYPSMRLFRQRSVGNWEELFERVARELAARAP
jgi:tetratricopeptide (TPR) repeat protein